MVLLLEACSALSDDYAPMMRALVTFAPTSLMRPCELFDLDWERDIDLEAPARSAVHASRAAVTGAAATYRNRTRSEPSPSRHRCGRPRLAACDPRLLPHRVRVPQQDRGPAHRAHPYGLLERGPGAVAGGSGFLLLHEALRGLVHEGPHEPAGCRHRRPGGLVGAVRHEDGRKPTATPRTTGDLTRSTRHFRRKSRRRRPQSRTGSRVEPIRPITIRPPSTAAHRRASRIAKRNRAGLGVPSARAGHGVR